jgi:inner membrane protein involved in colicin E2 resistance
LDSKPEEDRLQVHKTLHHKFIMPEKFNVKASIKNSVRHKGFHNVPVYTSSIGIKGRLNRSHLSETLKLIKSEGSNVVIKKAFFSMVLSDPRGIKSIPTLTR